MTTEADIPDIDLPTGLPKLSIELLPDSEEENKPWSKYTRHDSFDRLPVRVEDMAAKVRSRLGGGLHCKASCILGGAERCVGLTVCAWPRSVTLEKEFGIYMVRLCKQASEPWYSTALECCTLGVPLHTSHSSFQSATN